MSSAGGGGACLVKGLFLHCGKKVKENIMAGKLMESLQTDLSTRIYRITNGFNEALYLVANEPSLGMYRLQEHIQATVPKVVEQRQTLHQVSSQLNSQNITTDIVLSLCRLKSK